MEICCYVFAFASKSLSSPGANSCGVSGSWGISKASGLPCIVSNTPSPNGEFPVMIFPI
jgi:hypothetical protein